MNAFLNLQQGGTREKKQDLFHGKPNGFRVKEKVEELRFHDAAR
jgi:hypothetical protein